jgi:carboxyl-terminal processing protease
MGVFLERVPSDATAASGTSVERMRRSSSLGTLGLVMALLMVAGCRTAAREEAPPTIAELIRDRFYDAERGAAWAARHPTIDREARDVIDAAIAELQASHTEYVPHDDPRHAGLRAIFGPDRDAVTAPSIGLDIIEREGRWFVRRVFFGGPADGSGILRGDEIVSADERPFHPVHSLEGRHEVTLALRRLPHDPLVTRSVPVRVEEVRAAWLRHQRKGTRIERRGDVATAIVPLYSGAGEEFLDEMQSAIEGPLRSADALVLDLRDGFGGCSPLFVRPFVAGVPVLQSRSRDGRQMTYDPQWRRPLVVLINAGSRSGKELVARALQRAGRAVVVGERSAGAVLGGSLFSLGDGSLLYLAVQDVTVDGERLEGIGVAPDRAVPDQLEYAAGRDPQLEAAIEEAARLVRAAGPVRDSSDSSTDRR